MQQTDAMMERSFLMIDLNDLSCSHCVVPLRKISSVWRTRVVCGWRCWCLLHCAHETRKERITTLQTDQGISSRDLSLLICCDPAGSYLKGRASMESQAERGSGRDGNEEVRIQTFYQRTLCIDQFSSLFVFTGKQNIVK